MKRNRATTRLMLMIYRLCLPVHALSQPALVEVRLNNRLIGYYRINFIVRLLRQIVHQFSIYIDLKNSAAHSLRTGLLAV